jgi:hypothetical protein
MSRGLGNHSKDIIEASHEILLEIEPASVRAVCYRLFVRQLIDSMAKNETNKISRLLRIAREHGDIPWEWIVDETGGAERISTWEDPQAYARAVVRSYRRDYWSQQSTRVEVWSEKGTVRGTLAPVLEEYGVTFRPMGGYASATEAHDVSEETATDPIRAFYVGDWDPSGLHMSEVDLPRRLAQYGGNVQLVRIALTKDDTNSGLPEFAAEEKCKDPRYKWFVRHYGHRCWELDALNPNELRARVMRVIRSQIDFRAWNRCKAVEQAELQSLTQVMESWGAP